MKEINQHTLQNGFALLEVMITVAILSIALLSLGGLHSIIIKSSSAAKARANATSLAQEKFDDLRSYQQLAAGGTGIFGFSEIGSNAGGSECDGTTVTENCPSGTAAGMLAFPNGTVRIGNVDYTRSWTSTNYYYCGANAAPTTTACTGGGAPSFKLIALNVNWTDEEGPQSIQLNSTISGMDPSSSGQGAIGSGGRGTPNVLYNPGVAPTVIPISLDGSTKKEATKPTPDTTAHKHSTVTSFDEITYNTTLNTKIRDAFFTVSCTCQQEGVPTSAEPKGELPTTFDGSQYIFGKEDANKRTGSTHRQGQYNEQPAVCDICCRDHHDNLSTAPAADTNDSCETDPNQFKCVYDPFRSTSDYHNNNDHNHYYDANNDGELELANDDGNLYYESCRMVRSGGLLKVLQDWRLEAIQITPSTFLQVSGNIASYQDYVTTFIEEYLKGINAATYPQTIPNTKANATVIAKQNAFLWESGNATYPPYSMTLSTSEDFVGRAIYMDYMDKTLLNKLKCKINGSGSDCTDITVDSGYLNFTPFHEVNVTRLANWSSSDASKVTVTNEPLDPGTETTYSRGTASAIAAGSSVLTATIKRSNTGLTDNDAIDKTATAGDADDTLIESDTLAITVSNTSPPSTNITVSGNITVANNAGDRTTSDIIITGINGATCTRPLATSYKCTMDNTGSGGIVISNFTATTANNGSVNDNCVAPSTTDKGSNFNDARLGSYPTGEYRTLSYSLLAANLAMNLAIKQGSNGTSADGVVTGSSCP